MSFLKKLLVEMYLFFKKSRMLYRGGYACLSIYWKLAVIQRQLISNQVI